MPAVGDSAANREQFKYHQEGLTELALLLIDYTQQERHPYYHIIHRSKGTLAAAEATIVRARQCARLFAGYYRKPKTYDQVDAVVELRYLQSQLTNLWNWLKPQPKP